MALILRWTPQALMGFEDILHYIEHKFGKSSAQTYASKVQQSIRTLQVFPALGTLQDSRRNIRGLVIKKHTYLFYIASKETLTILNIFDNRKDPKSRW